MVSEILRQFDRCRLERRTRFCRERQEVRSLRSGGGFDCGRFLKDNMGVGAPNPKGTDTRAARRTVSAPFDQSIIHIEWTPRKIYLGIGSFKVEARRKHPVP